MIGINEVGLYEIKIDFGKMEAYSTNNIVYTENDFNTAKIKAQLVKHEEIIDLTNIKVEIKIMTASGATMQYDVDVLDAKNGLVAYTFSDNALYEGINYFQLILIENKQRKISPKLSYKILDVIDDSGIIAEPNYPILIQLVDEVKDLKDTTNKFLETSKINENIRIEDEKTRVKQENDRQIANKNMQDTFEKKIKEIDNTKNELVNDVNSKITEVNNTKSQVINDIQESKTQMLNELTTSKNQIESTVANKVNEFEVKINELYTQDIVSEVNKAKDGEKTLKDRLERDVKKNEIINESFSTSINSNTLAIKNLNENLEKVKKSKDISMDDVLYAKTSEPLTTYNSNEITIGTGLVNTNGDDVEKDYRNQMKRSLVTIDNIVGHTVVKNRKLWDINLSNLATYNPRDVVEIFKESVYNNHQSDYNTQDNRLWMKSASNEFGYVQYKFIVKPYTDYMLCFDMQEITGDSYVEVATSDDGEKSNVICDIHNTSGIFNTETYTIVYVRFFCNAEQKVADKEVRYFNAKLIKVKDYYSGNVILRSLPNGVYDELHNCKVIKKIGKHVLNGYENWSIVDNSKPNTNSFACKLPDAISKSDKAQICLQNNVYESVSENELYNSDKICMSMNNLGQLVFRTGKNIATEEQLKEHLKTKETNITVYYEITPILYDMETQNKLDNISLSLVADSGDKLYLGSPVIPAATSHRIQLSTQAQIQELQNDVVEIKKNFWDTIKGWFNCEFQINSNNGFLKMPPLLGGVLIQWGQINIQANSSYVSKCVNFPIAHLNLPGVYVNSKSNAWMFANATGITESGFTLYGIKPDGVLNQYLEFTWFSIGV